jgi:hypothetical protein
LSDGLANLDIFAFARGSSGLFVSTLGRGVYRLRNGMTGWDEVNSGLTNGAVRALAANAAGAFAGTVGSGVWFLPARHAASAELQTNADRPGGFSLGQNYPNPFNPTTVIRFKVPSSNFVTLEIYDVLGRRVRTLVNRILQAGSHEVTFDARGLAGGTYFYTLGMKDATLTKKLTVLQ